MSEQDNIRFAHDDVGAANGHDRGSTCSYYDLGFQMFAPGLARLCREAAMAESGLGPGHPGDRLEERSAPLSEKDNIHMVDRYIEAMNAHDCSRMRSCQAEDFQAYVPGMPEPIDAAAYQAFYEASWTAFPDMTYEEGKRVVDGDCVMGNLTMTGTHTGPLATSTGDNLPASGSKIRLPASGTMEFKDGKLVREAVYYDRMTLLAQLGIRLGA